MPKDNGKDTRLVFHLSYPRLGKTKQQKSVNGNTLKEICTVKYPDFDKAIQLCMATGAKKCKLGHSDVRSAFRNLCMNKSAWKFLLMKARSPIDNQWYYFVDKCLPFGASISCAHFQLVSDAIAHIVRYRTKKDLVNYLDDFLFIALLANMCNMQVETFLQVCHEINLLISEEKTFWASSIIIFLGLIIDAIAWTVSVPVEKITKAAILIDRVLEKSSKKITVNQLQKICGFLNFLCHCVLLGRAFTR